MNAWSDITHFRVQILAQGDFNDDGLDDMFVAVSGSSIEGTYTRTDLFLLTRENIDAVFYVLHAKQPFYNCKCGGYPEYYSDFPPELFID